MESVISLYHLPLVHNVGNILWYVNPVPVFGIKSAVLWHMYKYTCFLTKEMGTEGPMASMVWRDLTSLRKSSETW